MQVEYACLDGMHRAAFALENLGDNREFMTLLRDHAVETIHSQEATLEDVFVQVTGRSLL